MVPKEVYDGVEGNDVHKMLNMWFGEMVPGMRGFPSQNIFRTNRVSVIHDRVDRNGLWYVLRANSIGKGCWKR